MKDLDFLSGKFFDYSVPKDKRYLLRYFKSDLQRAFLKYLLVFGDVKMFCQHTGYHCSRQLILRFTNRYKKITSAYEKAKKELTEENMEIILQIERGKYR